MASGRNLTVYLTSDVSKFRQGLKGAERDAKTFGQRLGTAVKVGGAALAAGAAAAVAVTFDAIRAAADDQASQAKLARAMKNTTKATQAQVDAMADYVDAAQKKSGMDDGELRDGLATLLRYTEDVTRAQQLSDAALEISAGTGKDYLTVVSALAKAETGQTSALKKLKIPVGEAAKNYADLAKANKDYSKAQDAANTALEEYGPKSEEYAKALQKVKDKADVIAKLKGGGTKWLAELNDQFEGSVADDANTYAGGIKRVATAWSELQEAFGQGAMGGTDAPGMMNDLADSLYDAAPAAQIAGDALNKMMIGLVQNLPAFLAGLKGLQLGTESWVDNVKLVPGEIADFLGFIPDGMLDPARNTVAANDAARQAALDAFLAALQPTPRPNPYDSYRPMRTTQRYRDASKGADTRAAQKDARTRQDP